MEAPQTSILFENLIAFFINFFCVARNKSHGFNWVCHSYYKTYGTLIMEGGIHPKHLLNTWEVPGFQLLKYYFKVFHNTVEFISVIISFFFFFLVLSIVFALLFRILWGHVRHIFGTGVLPWLLKLHLGREFFQGGCFNYYRCLLGGPSRGRRLVFAKNKTLPISYF